MNTSSQLPVALGVDPFGRTTMQSLIFRDAGNTALADRLAATSKASSIYERRRAAMARMGTVDLSVLERAVARGMRCSALGVDVRRVLPTGSTVSLLDDVDTLAALRLLVFEAPFDGHVDACLVAPRLWRADQPARESSAASSTLPPSLREDGFLRVPSWTTFGLDIDVLAAQVAAVLDAHVSDEPVRRSKAPLPALWPLLNNAALAALVRSYLGGGAVRYEGHMILEVPHPSSRCHQPSHTHRRTHAAAAPWPVHALA
jgi:hypothetical protein